MEKRGIIIDRAKTKVNGLPTMFSRLEQKIVLGGLSESSLKNYGRYIARISLHFNRIPIQLEDEEITGYLFDLAREDTHFQESFQAYGLQS